MDASLFNGARCSIGQGVVLDGRDDFVELADAPQGGAMSLGMWLKLDTLTQADGGNPNPNPDPIPDPNPNLNPSPNPDLLTLTQADGGNRHQYMSAFYDGGQNDEIRLYFIKGGLRLAVWPEDKSPYCPPGNRGGGGYCNCAGAIGWVEGEWMVHGGHGWCYEGKCYTGQPYAACEGTGDGFGGALGDGTWCYASRRDTECPVQPSKANAARESLSSDNGWNLVTESDTAYWMHIAATIDSSGLRVYLNGTLVGNMSSARLPERMQRVHHRLGRGPYGNHLAGRINSFKVWEYGLSSDEVATEYASGMCPHSPPSPPVSPSPPARPPHTPGTFDPRAPPAAPPSPAQPPAVPYVDPGSGSGEFGSGDWGSGSGSGEWAPSAPPGGAFVFVAEALTFADARTRCLTRTANSEPEPELRTRTRTLILT